MYQTDRHASPSVKGTPVSHRSKPAGRHARPRRRRKPLLTGPRAAVTGSATALVVAAGVTVAVLADSAGAPHRDQAAGGPQSGRDVAAGPPLGGRASVAPDGSGTLVRQPDVTPSATAPARPGLAAAPARPSPRPTPARKPAPRPPADPPQPFEFYDSTVPSSVPAGKLLATYATGKFAVPESALGGRPVIWIDAWATDPQASVLDIEPGDATPAMAVTWVRDKLTADPSARARLYTPLGEWQEVQDAVSVLPASMRSHIRWWIADPTGVNHVVKGADATQWFWGTSYDISTALPGF